jgi:hypothetical protein
VKKQLIRIAALTLFATTFAIGSARAQSARSTQMVTIPFDFFVGADKLPAGDYTLRAEDSSAAMRIQSSDQSTGTFFSIRRIEGLKIQNDSKLVFHKYGDDYFLSQVWTAGRATGDQLSKTKRERMAEPEIAKRAGKPEQVVLTMRAN